MGDIVTIALNDFMKEYDETEEEKQLHARRVAWDKESKEKMTEYRKAVRRDFFRRKAIYDKLAAVLCRAGVFTDGVFDGGERSVAGPGQRTVRGQSLPPPYRRGKK